MDFYFNLICTREREANWPKVNVVPVELFTRFDAHGYNAVKDLTQGRNIFDCDLLFIPMKSFKDASDRVYNIVLCALDMKLKKITLYDAMGRSSDFLQGFYQVHNYLNQEYQRIYQQPLLDGPFNFILPMDPPISSKNYHSRVFTCLYAEFLSRGEPLRMTEEIFFYRLKIVSEVYNRKIEHPKK